MTTKERLDELEERILNLEMNLQTKLLKKNIPPAKRGEPREKTKGASKKKSK